VSSRFIRFTFGVQALACAGSGQPEG